MDENEKKAIREDFLARLKVELPEAMDYFAAKEAVTKAIQIDRSEGIPEMPSPSNPKPEVSSFGVGEMKHGKANAYSMTLFHISWQQFISILLKGPVLSDPDLQHEAKLIATVLQVFFEVVQALIRKLTHPEVMLVWAANSGQSFMEDALRAKVREECEKYRIPPISDEEFSTALHSLIELHCFRHSGLSVRLEERFWFVSPEKS